MTDSLTVVVQARDIAWLKAAARSLLAHKAVDFADAPAREVPRHHAEIAEIRAIHAQLESAEDPIKVSGDSSLLREIIHAGAQEIAEPLSDALAQFPIDDESVREVRARATALVRLIDLLTTPAKSERGAKH